MKFITTSWDDGNISDFRLADLLQKYNLPATFYIPRSNPERAVMNASQIKMLSQSFEIGGHTLNHVRLDVGNKMLVKQEVEGCFEWLSQLMGHKPVSFCFPLGKYNEFSKETVLRSGFRTARTTELLKIKNGGGSRLVATTIQVFEHSRFTYIRHLLKRGRIKGLAGMLQLKPVDLEMLVHLYLSKVAGDHGCFHLWGHSWEIDQFNLWNKLEDLFKILSHLPMFCYATNKDLPLAGSP